MLIDWFTVVAQVLNFLILVWLLKCFLYHPILDAINVREKRIAAEVADADSRKAEATKERDAFAGRNKMFDEQRDALLTKATDEATAEKTRLLNIARKAAEQADQARLGALGAQADQLSQALGRRVQQEVFAITRKVLTDLASTSLEERVADVVVKRLAALDDDAKKVLVTALSASSDAAVLRTAFDLPAEQQAAIQKALDACAGTRVHVQFETTPAFVSGIELTAGGQKLGWTMGGYLASLKDSLHDVLGQQQASSPTPEPESVAAPGAKPA
jgi:F-type H+-transporting ATPase subunit b